MSCHLLKRPSLILYGTVHFKSWHGNIGEDKFCESIIHSNSTSTTNLFVEFFRHIWACTFHKLFHLRMSQRKLLGANSVTYCLILIHNQHMGETLLIKHRTSTEHIEKHGRIPRKRTLLNGRVKDSVPLKKTTDATFGWGVLLTACFD